MKSIGFINGDIKFHYEHANKREEIVKMHDDYLDSIEQYREEGYTIY